METLFWVAVGGVLYPYLGYPLVLWVLGCLRREVREAQARAPQKLPSVSIIIPVHNEEARIASKIANTAALHYPSDRLQVLFVSDGSTDRTMDIIRETATPAATIVELPGRLGKAAALNAGLERATNDILVFSDASIVLEPQALQNIVGPFADPRIGCVSGEDRITDSGGEASYGRYELLIRRLESAVHSLVGASGSFYAQRRSLCAPFTAGLAPDFLSVLRTVEQGFRAVSEPTAVGTMTAVKSTTHEFERKVRTIIRGMTTLFAHVHLLNPLRTGVFSFTLFSHKVMRWLAPFFLLGALVAPLALFDRPFYRIVLLLQAGFYLSALGAFAEWGQIHRSFLGKLALYFSMANTAIVAAWFQYGIGVRQEVWTPSRR